MKFFKALSSIIIPGVLFVTVFCFSTPQKNNVGYNELLSETKWYSLLKRDEITFPKVVIFDYDDTLVDSWPIALKVFNDCLVCLGHDSMSPEEQYALPHIPDPELLSIITGRNLEEVYSIYRKFYDLHHKKCAPPLLGAIELLKYLKKRHVYLILISNKPTDLLHKALKALKWEMFDKVIGAGDFPVRKPDPEIVDIALQDIALKSRKLVWFVGDSYTDMQCAYASKVTPVWVKEKSRDKFVLSENGLKVFTVNNLEDLLKTLKKFERARK